MRDEFQAVPPVPNHDGRSHRPSSNPCQRSSGDPLRTVVLGAPNVYHAGLTATLCGAPSIELVGEWNRVVDDVLPPVELEADVAVLDLDVWGAESVRQLATDPARLGGGEHHVPIIAVTASESIELGEQAIYAGARGVLLKEARPDEIVDAVHTVAGGAAVLAQHLVTWLLEEALTTKLTGATERHPSPRFSNCDTISVTPRQQQILTLVASGLTNGEIAERLFVSVPTVKSHVSALLRTFDVRDRTRLALLATQHGL